MTNIWSFVYITNINVRIAASIVGIPIINPYSVNFKNVISTPCFFKILIHIIPARAPIGVKYAPMFEPIIVAKIALFCTVFVLSIISVKNKQNESEGTYHEDRLCQRDQEQRVPGGTDP